jgi:hypothetical protein
MQEHSRYEELCAASGVGQITPEELMELQIHAEACPFCRGLQSEFVEISSVWLSQVQKLKPDIYDPRSALRKNILRRLDAAGAKFSTPLRKEIAEAPQTLSRIQFGLPHSRASVWAVALIIVSSAVGFGVGSLRHSNPGAEKLTATASAPGVPAGNVAAPAPILPPQSHVDALAAQQNSNLQEKLRASEAEHLKLQNELKNLTEQIAGLKESANRDAGSLAQLQATANQRQDALISTQAQLQSLKDAQASKDGELVAAQYRMRELEGKLAEQAATTERERQLAALSSNSELRDVIASRNLHIIDVADVDHGGVRKPFGRVFYTEGKSLIFYAYDLSKTKGKQTFYAWGHKEGDPTSTALGALSNDDEAQKRWVFRFNDAKVLAKIDSVYITLEPNERPGDKPRGEELLKAFLGTPANHP